MKGMNAEQKEKFLEEEAQAKAHDDQKTRHVLKTTGLFRGGGNPLKNGGGRGGRGGGPRRATINIPPVVKATEEHVETLAPVVEPTPVAKLEKTAEIVPTPPITECVQQGAEESPSLPQSPSSNQTSPANFDAQASMLAGMSPEQREAFLLEQAKAKEHEDMRTRHVLKTTGLFRAAGGNPLKAGGGRGGKGRRTSVS